MKWLLEALVRWGRRPGSVASSEDKTVYPRTYTIMDYINDREYLTRVVFPRVFGIRPLLHRFHQGDGDRALHNHPWKWCISIVLSGSYTEERAGGKWRRVRWFNKLTDKDFHRVVELHGDVWTLFITGPRAQGWGFKEGSVVTPHEEYIARMRAEL